MAKVLFFAALSEAVGVDEADLDLTEALSVSAVLELLERKFPPLVRFERSFRVAVNQVFAEPERLVHPDDEIALIPPVSGGHQPVVRAAIKTERLDMSVLTHEVMSPRCGAVVTFMGTVRDLTGDLVTDHLHYSSYTEMAEKELLEICKEAVAKWDLGGAVVEHRVGELHPGEIAVVACCSAPHRGEAFDAARFLIDTTKERVPIWKKEFGPDGASWV